MTGFTAQKYEHIKAVAEKRKLSFSINGDRFQLKTEDGQNLGFFEDVEAVWNFIHGYAAGYRAGKAEQ